MGDKVCSVRKVALDLGSFGNITTERKHVLDTCFGILFKDGVDVARCMVETSQVGNGKQSGFLGEPSNKQVGVLACCAASAIGDADKGGLKRLKLSYAAKERSKARFRARREEFEGDRGAIFCW